MLCVAYAELSAVASRALAFPRISFCGNCKDRDFIDVSKLENMNIEDKKEWDLIGQYYEGAKDSVCHKVL